MTAPKGAVVVRVSSNSPASRAGIKVKDIILKFNGKELSKSDALPPLVENSPLNRAATLRVLRNGREQDIQVMIKAK